MLTVVTDDVAAVTPVVKPMTLFAVPLPIYNELFVLDIVSNVPAGANAAAVMPGIPAALICDITWAIVKFGVVVDVELLLTYVPASNPTSLLAVALAITKLNCVAGVAVVFVNLKLPALLDAVTFGILALLILLTMSVIVYVTKVVPEEVKTTVDVVNAVEVFAINQSLTSSVYVPAAINV